MKHTLVTTLQTLLLVLKPRYKPYYASRGGTLKHLSLFWYTTLQTLLWLKGRYIEALKFVLVYHVTNLIMAQLALKVPLNYPSRGGTLKHLSLFWYTTLQTLLCLKGRYIEALKFVLVYHVTNLIMAQGKHLRYIEALEALQFVLVYHVTNLIMPQWEVH